MAGKEKRLGLNALSYVASLLIGVATGYVGGPAVAMVWWALLGLLLGWFSDRKKASLMNGALYGFALAYTFMLAGYSGSESVLSKLVPFVAFGVFGSICGACLGLVGYLIRRKR